MELFIGKGKISVVVSLFMGAINIYMLKIIFQNYNEMYLRDWDSKREKKEDMHNVREYKHINDNLCEELLRRLLCSKK